MYLKTQHSPIIAPVRELPRLSLRVIVLCGQTRGQLGGRRVLGVPGRLGRGAAASPRRSPLPAPVLLAVGRVVAGGARPAPLAGPGSRLVEVAGPVALAVALPRVRLPLLVPRPRPRPAGLCPRRVALVPLSLVVPGSRPLLRFLATDPRDLGADTRVLVWTHALEAWKSYPVFGSGLGTFREAFRVVQPRDLPGLVEAAHGDFLQLLVTGGALGALLGIVAWVSLSLILLRGALLRIRHEEGAFALAGLGALVSIALHGLVEFNLSVPATAVTLALVAGAAAAACRDAETRAGS